jgi:hypothetical protein
MTLLAHQRCLNHAGREAAARCPDCRRYFCRECVTEHEGRVLCASCLTQLSASRGRRGRGLLPLLRAAQFAAGLFVLWFAFYLLGKGLLAVPTEFHDGTLWRTSPWQDE